MEAGLDCLGITEWKKAKGWCHYRWGNRLREHGEMWVLVHLSVCVPLPHRLLLSCFGPLRAPCRAEYLVPASRQLQLDSGEPRTDCC